MRNMWEGLHKNDYKQPRLPDEAAQKIHTAPKSCDINPNRLSKDFLPVQAPGPM